MKFIIERTQNDERTFYGPFYLKFHAQQVINKHIVCDTEPATYHIHILLPQANL